MALTMKIPDDLAHDLGAGFENLGLAALEALAAEASEKDVLSLEQVRRMLELESTWQAQEVLSRHESREKTVERGEGFGALGFQGAV